MADCQFGMYEEDTSWDREIKQLRQALVMIEELQPRFVVLCGDMTNARPGDPAYLPQLRDYQAVIAELAQSIPLYTVAGNHDIGNTPTAAMLKVYREEYGADQWSFMEERSQCIGLNSCLYFDPTELADELEAQDKWLHGLLGKELEGKRFVFTHHPIFRVKGDEPDDYFNIPLERRLPLLKALQDAGPTYCFAGHYHRNAQGVHGNVESITTSAVGMALGDEPSGFRLVTVYDDRIEHQYLTLR